MKRPPRVQIAVTSVASAFNGKLQVESPRLGDAIAFRAKGAFPKYSLLVPVRYEKHPEARNVFRSLRIAIFGRPKSMRPDKAGDLGREIKTDFRTGRLFKLQFRGAGAHPWLPAPSREAG